MLFDLRYSLVMGRISISIAIVACVSLLVLQSSGLHLHVDAVGQETRLHVAPLHHATQEVHSHHGIVKAHDHSVETDAPLLELLNSSWTKLIPLLIVVMSAILLGLRLLTRLQLAPAPPGKVRHLKHWRPPLRAPPISL